MARTRINKDLLSHKIKTSRNLTATEKRYILELIENSTVQEIPEILNPSSEPFGMMVVSAARYAMGRMSCIVGETVDFVDRYLPYLSESTLQNLNMDITFHQQNNDLGMLCDSTLWLGLRDSIQSEIQQRRKDFV